MPEQTTSRDDLPPVQVQPIGYVVTGYDRPEVAPPQATENFGERASLVVYERYADGLSGLENCPHIWLVTWLHSQREDEAAELRCVPRGLTGTGERRGVFSTRSPNRPSRLGMSLVRVAEIDGNVIHFYGVDLVDGTPVLDIKPWVRGTDVPPRG
ncbi:tRNA (N6-threonylcarbamoyladenosine(37)-N6)-methyltransferase TrmO [Sphaerisporangium sp. TRM90804]|uniref:tRNA (N6-threonylcarbamoyladenosine(37)-N6)-methyltransferase TrmO n=1 Tax=Sphaerisporangium sp. TRM90804 TaxID=3031113 RepID=UPI00244897DC|nr:tRNA (N6-threonylcarbamoyladenosine(37)-N6)-methyltransferase TrmO [Sphaerisporangium sp. TRM90804]MDH2428031.1 tRNA (N6-threonylcarbamoyladenosine(37)-N6)-methyltransferase TrmO [Sphaerisporangium sp. TRM90804]